jgi:hypothetical protein
VKVDRCRRRTGSNGPGVSFTLYFHATIYRFHTRLQQASTLSSWASLIEGPYLRWHTDVTLQTPSLE